MNCQKCKKSATLHITEIVTEDKVEEYHLCEECAHRYLYEPQKHQQKSPAGKASKGGSAEELDEPNTLNHECDICGIKFVDFRNTGRLGCPHDYEEFRDELIPLLENIHGETKHNGKTPQRLPETKEKQAELVQLRAPAGAGSQSRGLRRGGQTPRPHQTRGRSIKLLCLCEEDARGPTSEVPALRQPRHRSSDEPGGWSEKRAAPVPGLRREPKADQATGNQSPCYFAVLDRPARRRTKRRTRSFVLSSMWY